MIWSIHFTPVTASLNTKYDSVQFQIVIFEFVFDWLKQSQHKVFEWQKQKGP